MPLQMPTNWPCNYKLATIGAQVLNLNDPNQMIQTMVSAALSHIEVQYQVKFRP